MDKKSGLMLVFFTAIVSGFSIFINKFGVKGIDSGIFTFLKNIVVAFFILSLMLLLKEYKELLKLKMWGWGRLALIGLFGGSIPFLLFFRGLQLASAPVASLIHKSMFLFIIVLAYLFLKERIDKRILAGALLLFAGNLLMLKIKNFDFNYGALLILIATLFWAVENTLSKYTLRELSGNAVIFGRMFFGSLFILLFLAFTGKLQLIAAISKPQVYWILLSTGFLSLYVISWYNGLKYIELSVASCVLVLGSAVTTALDYFFGAPLTAMGAIGMLLLIIGVVLVVGVSELSGLLKYFIKVFSPKKA